MFLAGNCTPARQLAAGRGGFGQEVVFFYPRYLFENGRLCYNRRKFQLFSLVQSVMTARLEETCTPGRGSVKESADENILRRLAVLVCLMLALALPAFAEGEKGEANITPQTTMKELRENPSIKGSGIYTYVYVWERDCGLLKTAKTTIRCWM